MKTSMITIPEDNADTSSPNFVGEKASAPKITFTLRDNVIPANGRRPSQREPSMDLDNLLKEMESHMNLKTKENSSSDIGSNIDLESLPSRKSIVGVLGNEIRNALLNDMKNTNDEKLESNKRGVSIDHDSLLEEMETQRALRMSQKNNNKNSNNSIGSGLDLDSSSKSLLICFDDRARQQQRTVSMNLDGLLQEMDVEQKRRSIRKQNCGDTSNNSIGTSLNSENLEYISTEFACRSIE